MAYGVSNGHVTDDVQLFSTDDVTWAQKVKLVTPICLEHSQKQLEIDAI